MVPARGERGTLIKLHLRDTEKNKLEDSVTNKTLNYLEF
jgi:hypothetical protein